MGMATICTPIKNIAFSIVSARTPFLLSLKNLTKTGTYFNNLENCLVHKNIKILTIMAYGHAWIFFNNMPNPIVISNH